MDPGDFLGLPRREFLVRIECHEVLQQPLAPQDFVDAGNATGESILWIEDRGVRVCERGTDPEKIMSQRGIVSQ